MLKATFHLCVEVWNREEVPEEWMKGIIFPIPKKSNREKMSEYRGISLLSVVGKVFAVVLNRRLSEWAENVLVEEQFGFRKNRGCRDPLFILSEIVKNRGTKTVYAAFMDIRKAYPSVWRNGLWWKMWKMGVRGKMWRVLKKWNQERKCGVVWKGEIGKWFDMEVGVAQGIVLCRHCYFRYLLMI